MFRKNLVRFSVVGIILLFVASLAAALSYTNTDDFFLDNIYDASAGDGSDSDTSTVVVGGEAVFTTSISVDIQFLKTDGTCESPAAFTPFDNEIVFSLTSPSGTVVDLVTAGTWPANTTSAGLVTMTFDDGALESVNDITAPTTGDYRPVEPLNTFLDEDPNGEWTLFMEDTVSLDPLCVYEWTLNINLDGGPACTVLIPIETTIEVLENSGEFSDAIADVSPDGVTFELEPDDPTLFSDGPTMASDGTLTFTPAPDAFGITEVTVTASLDDSPCGIRAEAFTIIIIPVNDPPVCDEATVSPHLLWPPNHRMVDIEIGGITDADSDLFVFTSIEITADEPVNDIGDGNTDPDWMVTSSTLDSDDSTIILDDLTTHSAAVRAERAGPLDGRIYTINFTVDDANFTPELDPEEFALEDVEDGGDCDGVVEVFVPHDMGQGLASLEDLLPEAAHAPASITSSMNEFGLNATTIHLDDDNDGDDETPGRAPAASAPAAPETPSK